LGRPLNGERGYTLVELFLTLAVLMIILGLMINLANRVRRESADRLTRQTLARLTVLMGEYQARHNGELPAAQPLVDSGQAIDETTLHAAARLNNADFVTALNLAALAKKSNPSDDATNDPLRSSLITTGPDTGLLEDPWGSPIVFMPRQDPAIGMAPGDAFFFVSAGPDRKYLTREDNVYSYEGGLPQ
jgi:type II secretory pathway pseudopilin PulG